jgi:uncharacterized membrane protein YccC
MDLPHRLAAQAVNALAWLRDRVAALKPQLRYCLRVSVAGVAAFAITSSLELPLHGLWAVLTAIIVSQVSVGGSLRATIEYNVGTLAGALYGAAVGLAVPHATPVAQAVALAVSVAPMAAAAAIHPTFRVAPFSAVLVLLIGSQLGESPIASAATRVVEVVIGGLVAVVVSLIVFPERAEGLGHDAAGQILNQMADLLPKLLAGASRDTEKAEIGLAQSRLGGAVVKCQELAEEARRERVVSIVRHPDPAPLARTLMRIRTDLVMLSRATVEPLPEAIARRLGSLLERVGDAAAAYLSGSAAALAGRRSPPAIGPTEAALGDFGSEVAAIRNEGLSRGMETAGVARFFALAFSLEQLSRDLADLAPRVQEHTDSRRR